MNSSAGPGGFNDVWGARSLFPATEKAAYFNTAAVGLASRTLAASYHRFVDDWAQDGLDDDADRVRPHAAGGPCRVANVC